MKSKDILGQKRTSVSNEITVNTRLELVGIVGLNGAGSSVERGEVNLTHAV